MQAAMMKNALPVTVFGDSAQKILSDVRTHGKRLFLDNERPAFVLQTAEEYDSLMELLADWRVEQIAEERLAKPMGKGISFEEMLAESGLTQEELDAMPEVEIE